jgi:hypothetical protein
MNDISEFVEIDKHLRSPKGLKDFGPYFILSLFTHPALRVETTKDVNEMADKFVFFHDDKVVYVLTMPWNLLFGPNEELTKKYEWLLEREKKNG